MLLPYYFIADSAFPLTGHIVKPFPGLHSKDTKERIFNYHLRRSPPTSRVLQKPMSFETDKAALVIITCFLFHYHLRESISSTHICLRVRYFGH
ncbi:hypothetical protein PR048_012851 [Dryococelus australis]|uniref:DDE Tnp4 domain-containing protein n=1 Tax=Dryococelus australis TaxID=614101 RepID=A0ABQ9HQJ9_9NEOP|nr:hypothetical protein PR048_012851 [Dryococelus australis]